jgi:hypothetical protein
MSQILSARTQKNQLLKKLTVKTSDIRVTIQWVGSEYCLRWSEIDDTKMSDSKANGVRTTGEVRSDRN